MYVRTLELRTPKFSGFHSSKVRPLYQPMTSSAPSENWHNLTKFHHSMRLIFPLTSSRQSSLISSSHLLNMLTRSLFLSNKSQMLDKLSVIMPLETKLRPILMNSLDAH